MDIKKLSQEFPALAKAIEMHKSIMSLQTHQTKGYPLTDPIHMVACIIFYLAFIAIGTKVMASRKPFELATFRKFHNLALVLLSSYMAIEAIRQAVLGKYKLVCNAVDESPAGQPMANIVYIFYVSKVYEFVDTFIMVLRKKNEQVNFLQVYHHASIFAIWWYLAFRAPTGEPYYSVILNSTVHVIMYAYYLGTCFGYSFWWKKYLTMFQMTQFVTMFAQALYILVNRCPYPRHIAFLQVFYMLSLLILFGNFFVQSYISKSKQRSSRKKLT
mmetsp:Transcript_6699/g.10447  ORF Transcript_6699/g.10447 Transcript_6699/m.10447 type:complete len:272 (-) Transcript_6699:416-1231(-)